MQRSHLSPTSAPLSERLLPQRTLTTESSASSDPIGDDDPPPPAAASSSTREVTSSTLEAVPVSLAAVLPSSPISLAWLLIFLVALAAFWYLSRRLRTLRADNDPWADPAEVANTLIWATDKKAPITLIPLEADLPDLNGFCSFLDEQRLLAQLSGPFPDDWLGREASAQIRVPVGGEDKLILFDTVVLRGLSDGAYSLLELARPSRLERFERRACLRVTPRPDDILALGLWPYEADAPPPTRQEALGMPRFLRHPNREPGSGLYMDLEDANATGVAIRVKKGFVSTVPEYCITLLCLRLTPGKSLALWLLCELRHRTDHATYSVAGLHALQWASAERADEPLSWQTATSTVPPLMRWTLRRQAEERTNH